MLSEQSKQYLLKLARNAVRSSLKGEKLEYGSIPDEVKTESGVFVTLRKQGELRGCIGTLGPARPIYEAVAVHARDAALEDPRFPPVTADELPLIVFEISVLGPLQQISCDSSEGVVEILNREHPGVKIEYGPFSATYLPQVWDEIPDERGFLNSLCLKAGLPPDSWWDYFDEMVFYTYIVDAFEEDPE